MTFEELLDQTCVTAHLPEMARLLLPSALSDKTKEMLLKLSAEELGNILLSAIDAVNHGLMKPIDKLVKEQLNR